MTQAAREPEKPERKKRAPGDEGARYTAEMMRAVREMRQAHGWSAARLASEMSGAGVPWTRDTVVNLENGRRKSLHVHEAVALAWILDASTPLDVLVPPVESGMFPVTPHEQRPVTAVRAWFRGETGPLRRLPDDDSDMRRGLQQMVESGALTQDQADQMLRTVHFQQPAPYDPDADYGDGDD